MQDQDAYVGEITTVYSESPAPGDGVLQSVGKRSVEAVYLDMIQGSGRTNVSVSARADAVVGKTARIQFRPSADWNARNDHKFFYAGDRLAIWLTDTDLNLDDDRRETVDVTLRGSVLGDQYVLTLTEIKPELGEFIGFFQTRHAKSAVANGILEVTGTENVTVSHLDLLQGSGETDVVVAIVVMFLAAVPFTEVRLGELAKVEGDVADLAALKAANIVPRNTRRARVMLSGSIERALTVRGLKLTPAAAAAVEAAGGRVEAEAKGD